MKKDNILSLVIMGCALLIIISVFLPYVTYYSTSASLWKMEDSSRIIYILLGLLVMFVYLINNKTELSYLTVGFSAFTSIENIISMQGFDGFSIGFYLILLSSIIIGFLTYMYDETKADALINLSVSVNKPVINNNVNYKQPIMNNQMMDSPQPQIQQQPTITGYNPMTGEPIYSNQNNN